MKNNTKEKLRVIPLGGLDEIGKNMTIFEYGNDMIIVDCGMAFPDDELLGIDLVIPDMTYVERNVNKLRGIVITHAHEDHIGALPYFLNKMQTDVYGTRFAQGLIGLKLEDKKVDAGDHLKIINPGESFKLGCFEILFINSTHSIPGVVALSIKTPVGVVLHTADFKIDLTPIESEPIDLNKFSQIGNEGVLLMLADSTNSESPGYSFSERSIASTFDDIFKNSDGRIIVATFASNVHRVQQIIDASYKYNKKVAMFGRSLLNVSEKAMELGYLNVPENLLIKGDDLKNYSPNELVILSTGSQGETMSALSRMASATHRQVSIVPGDLVIISASSIPGNEKGINRVINELYKKGAEVIYEALADVHVSGHACREELKLMHSLVKPKFFIPVHGEYRHLINHAKIAKEMGMPDKNIFVMKNGDVLELDENSARRANRVPSGNILIDGLGIGDVGNIVLRDRKQLSCDGLIIVILTLDKESGEIISGPDIVSRGFVFVKESVDLMDKVKEVVVAALEKPKCKRKGDWDTKKNTIKFELRDFLYKEIRRSPMILPIMIDV